MREKGEGRGRRDDERKRKGIRKTDDKRRKCE